MGGGTGAAGATSGATVAGAGGVGPVLQPGAGGFQMPKFFSPQMTQNLGQVGPQMMKQGAQREQFVDQLARRGPPPAIQPVPLGNSAGIGQTVGNALMPQTQKPMLPRPIRMPMTRGEALTNPMPGIGPALAPRY